MKVLKENSDLSFGQLIDIATVDYLQYGVSDWKTNDASGKGFSRATISSGSSQKILTAFCSGIPFVVFEK